MNPTALQVETEVARIVAAAPFRDAPQLRAFLEFIVRETLAGRGEALKGYSIATLALGRPASFDPQIDPIVRVQAGRLRQALNEFYRANPASGLTIALERGSYAPSFTVSDEIGNQPRMTAGHAIQSAMEEHATIKSARKGHLRTLLLAGACAMVMVATGLWIQQSINPARSPAILPYSAFLPSLVVEGETPDATPELAILTERTRDALARFDDIIVVYDRADSAAPRIETRQGAQSIRLALKVSGASAGPDQVRFRARLIDKSDQTLVWSKEFDPVGKGPIGDRQRSAIVRSIATSVAQPYGAVHAHVRTRLQASDMRDDPYACVVAAFDYWHSSDARTHLAARQCLETRLAIHGNAAPLHALMSYLHLEEYRQGYNPVAGDPRDQALESARRAVQLAPASARAHQALLAAHFARNETDLAWRAAGEAMQLNPYDTDIVQDVGARHVQSGHYEKGLELLQQALDLNAAPPPWAVTFRAIALYMLGRTDESGSIALTLRGSEYPLAMMALVMGAAQARDFKVASGALERFLKIHPAIESDLGSYLKKLAFAPEPARQIVTDYGRARAWVNSNRP